MVVVDKINLSICIPTYNRARYLSVLLEMLAVEMARFPFSYEIVISDNASTDETHEVVQRFSEKLRINYLLRAENKGALDNYYYCRNHARGEISLYLADDDIVDVGALADYVKTMLDSPDLAVIYAPWLLFDMVAGVQHGTFYSQASDVMIERADYAALAKHIIDHAVFPEICLCRTDVFRRSLPTANDLAFWAFVNPGDFLSKGKILFAKKPFYISITRYFADENRSQLGMEEVEYAWDRYRGGLECLLGRAINSLDERAMADLRHGVEKLITARMAVALRLRWHKDRNPVDSYYLASRLRGLKAEHLLPATFPQIASKAALYFLASDPVLHADIKKLFCIGKFPDEIVAILRAQSAVDVCVSEQCPADARDAILFLEGDGEGFGLEPLDLLARNIRCVTEQDLVSRFS